MFRERGRFDHPILDRPGSQYHPMLQGYSSVANPAGALAAAVGLFVGGFACIPTSFFECRSDEQCRLANALGTCEPSGYCSFPDPQCDSGARYGSYAPSQLSSECVPAGGTSWVDPSDDGPATTSAEPDPTSTPGSTTGSTTGNTSDADSGTFSSATTSQGSGPGTTTEDSGGIGTGTSTGGVATSSGAATSSDDSGQSSSTTDGPSAEPDCLWIDDFSDGDLDNRWYTWGGSVFESNGMLAIPIPAGNDDYRGVVSGWLTFDDMRFAAELSDLPDASSVLQVITINRSTTQRVEIGLQGSRLSARRWSGGSYDQIFWYEHDASTQRHVQLRESGGRLYFETSPDGTSWTTVTNISLPFSMSQVRVGFTGGSYTPLSSSGSVGFGSARLCPLR